MKKFVVLMLFGMAVLLHFRTGVWSQDPKDAKKADMVEEKKEEKKEEAKKPEPDTAGLKNKDYDGLGTAVKFTDEKEREKLTAKDAGTAIGEITGVLGLTKAGLNMFYTLMTGFLVMFMQAGFAMVETGLCRAKSVAHTMAMNFMIYAIGMLGFYFVGFAIMYGGIGTSFFGSDPNLLTSEYKINIFGKDVGIFGYEGFMLTDRARDVGLLTMFLFQMVFMDTTCTIPTGAMAERWKFSAFVVFGFIVSTIIYPVYGNWVWGGGWLATMGANFGIGHGHTDFAGSSVVHMTGGVTALAGTLLLGARLGKYNKDGSVNVLPAHNVPMYMVGTFILAFGWFGFNAGSAFKATDLNIARCAVTTMLASAAGAFVSMAYMWLVYGKPDPSFMCNGMLAGLVAITAPCAFVTPLGGVIIGAIAGVLVIWSCLFWEKTMKVDDPVGAVSVHGVCGCFGVLAVGLFADGTYGQGWNGSFWYKTGEKAAYEWSPVSLSGDTAKAAIDAIEEGNKEKKADEKVEVPEFLKKLPADAKIEAAGVTGLFYGNTGQLKAQLIGIAANILYVFPVAFITFWLTDKIVGLRSKPEDERHGLDIPEMGVLGYINEDPKTPEGHLTYAGAEPRAAKAPPDGMKRFTVVVEGLPSEKIASIWSDLCQPGSKANADFLAIYPKMTTLQGNRFRFIDGDPQALSKHLGKIFENATVGQAKILTKVE